MQLKKILSPASFFFVCKFKVLRGAITDFAILGFVDATLRFALSGGREGLFAEY